MKNPSINILTRTHNREKYFNVCKHSIVNQTYKNVNWIVGSDIDCPYYPNAIKLEERNNFSPIPAGHYYAPYNEYLNQLATNVKDGWVMYLDDDDEFLSPNALTDLANQIDSEDIMLVWKVRITKNWIVPCKTFGQRIQSGDFSGIGFMFHSKYLPVDWGFISCGDYRVAQQLLNKGLKIKWVDEVLTSTQEGPHNGK